MFCHASEKYQMQLLMSLHNEILEHISEFWKCKLVARCFGLTVGMQTRGDTGTIPSASTWNVHGRLGPVSLSNRKERLIKLSQLQQRDSTMGLGLEHLLCEERLKELGWFSPGKFGLGILRQRSSYWIWGKTWGRMVRYWAQRGCIISILGDSQNPPE